MKYKSYLLILIFLFSSFKVFAIPRCEELLDVVYNDTIREDVNLHTIVDEKTIGIRLLNHWVEQNKDNKKNVSSRGDWQLKTNSNGYFLVGKITKASLSEEIMIGDVVISINDLDLREIAKDTKKLNIMATNISDLFKENELIKFKILRKNKITNKKEIFIVDRFHKNNEKPNIKNTLESFDLPMIDFFINSIEINEKEGFFDASIETSFLETVDERFFLTKAIFDTIVYEKNYDEKSRLLSYMYERCSFSDKEWQRLNTEDPAYGMKFDNLIKEDLTTRTSHYQIEPVISMQFGKKENGENNYDDIYYSEDKADVIYKSNSSYRIRNNFNLKTFPFDKQIITIYLKNEISDLDEYRSQFTSYSMRKVSEFKESNPIQGWNIISITPKYHISKDPAEYISNDGVKLELEIERKSRYYIFKIILPIILILTVCWSAVWINPREIESRLTITIVCLLSLIAYNFVIDSDMPKLEYLTIMDYIILISYVYATIPNFLSIAAFNLVGKNKKLSAKYENYGKRYGLLSYLMFILLIIIVNTNSSPEHTNTMLSWIAPS